MNLTNQKKTFRADTEGIRKLTRSAQRKLTVTCIAVAAIALILLGAGMEYLNGHDSGSENVSFEEMENSLKEQMRREMAEASAYLEKLDGSIEKNQKKLEEVGSQLAERQEAFQDAGTTQKKLEENASNVSVKMDELEDKAETQINELQGNMDSLHTDIRAILEKISRAIAELQDALQAERADHERTVQEISKMNEAVLEINKSIGQVETNLKQSCDSLTALLKELKSDDEKEQSELVRKLSDVEADLKTLLEADMEQITDAFAKLSEDLQTQAAYLSQLMDGRFDTLDQNMSGGFSNLDRNVNTAFGSLNQSVNGGFESLDQNVSGSFGSLNRNVSDGLESLDQNMSDGLENLDQNMSGSFESLAQSMGENFENLKLHVEGQFQRTDQTILMRSEELVSAAEQNREDLKAYLDALSNALKQDLNQVFTSVSNGKAGLASALLTKGVEVKADATFAQIRDAILSIDQKLVIGVQEIPGTVSYDYHYHQDVNGEYPHNEQSTVMGGCYNAGVRHVHSDSCYSMESYHEHTGECPTYTYLVDWVPEPYWARDYTCGNEPLNAAAKVLTCMKDTEVIEFYTPSCGFVDGQIIGAHIVYDGAAAAGGAGISGEAEEAQPQETQAEEAQPQETETEEAQSQETQAEETQPQETQPEET